MKHDWTLVAGWIVVGTVAVLMRCASATSSLWLDELHTAWCATGSWQEVAPRAWIGNQSPVYFYLARGMVAVCGPHELALRLPSLVAGLLLVPVAGWLVTQWSNSRSSGLLAAALVATDPHLVFYSQEARSYSLLLFVAWCHVALVGRLVNEATPARRVLFIAGIGAMCALHYTAALFCVGEALFLVFAVGQGQRRGEAAYQPQQLAVDLVMAALACSPLIWHLSAIYSHRGDWSSFVPPPSWRGIVRMFRLDLYLFLPLAVCLVSYLAAAIRRQQNTGSITVEKGALIASLLLVPMALAWGMTIVEFARLLYRRYLLPTYVAEMVLAALAVATIPSRWLRGGLAMAILAGSLVTNPLLQTTWWEHGLANPRRQDWRGAVTLVNRQRRGSAEAAFVRGGFLEADRLRSPHDPFLEAYCLAPVNSLYRLEIPAIPLPTTQPTRFEPSLQRRLEELDNIWFLVNGHPTSQEQFMEAIRTGWLANHSAWSIVANRQFGEVRVLGLSRRPPSP